MQNVFLERIKPYLNSYTELKPIATKTASNLSNFGTVKAIVFDIYGTLIISASGDLDKSTVTVKNLSTSLNEGGYYWINSELEQKYGEEFLDLFNSAVENQHAQLKKNNHPYPEVDIIKVWEDCLKIAMERRWLKANETTCVKTLTVVFEILSNPVWPMPDMHKVIDKLREKVPLGIVSNAQFYTPIIMNNFISNKITEQEYLECFDEDISVFSYKLLRSKPDTFLFEKLKGQLKIKYKLQPSEVLFVGNDMLKDVWTASQVGFKTALFAGDKRSLRLRVNDERCKNLKPDITINELSELLNLVGK